MKISYFSAVEDFFLKKKGSKLVQGISGIQYKCSHPLPLESGLIWQLYMHYCTRKSEKRPLQINFLEIDIVRSCIVLCSSHVILCKYFRPLNQKYTLQKFFLKRLKTGCSSHINVLFLGMYAPIRTQFVMDYELRRFDVVG